MFLNRKERATHLRWFRILNGVSQDEMAQRLGIDRAVLSRVERGLAQPPKRLLRNAEQVFGAEAKRILDLATFDDILKSRDAAGQMLHHIGGRLK